VRKVTLNSYAHQDLPFEKLVDELQITRSLSRMPLFQVVFVFQKIAGSNLEVPGLKLTPMGLDAGLCHFDLTCSILESESGLSCHLQYNTDLFNCETIGGMLEHFRSLLEEVTARPESRLLNIPLVIDGQEGPVTPLASARETYEVDQFAF
jgi:non-ribosomal peptide synthetase component F